MEELLVSSLAQTDALANFFIGKGLITREEFMQKISEETGDVLTNVTKQGQSMTKRSYWLDLFTGVTWNEFNEAGGKVTGFRESRWTTVQKVKSGDYLLCYLTGISRFIGILEVIGKPYKDKSPIWKDEVFPCRLKVKIVAG